MRWRSPRRRSTLSNFYGGLIAAVITPVAIGAYWLARARFAPHAGTSSRASPSARSPAWPCAGLAFVWWQAPGVVRDRAALAFPREDLFSYSAKWWSYLVPPVAHPLLGGARPPDLDRGAASATGCSSSRSASAGASSPSAWSRLAVGWFRRRSDGGRAMAGVDSPIAGGSVPILVAVAVAALVCSLVARADDLRRRRSFDPRRCSISIVPMFRSYARFGVIVQLMAALLAGIGADAASSRGARVGPGRSPPPSSLSRSPTTWCGRRRSRATCCRRPRTAG